MNAPTRRPRWRTQRKWTPQLPPSAALREPVLDAAPFLIVYGKAYSFQEYVNGDTALLERLAEAKHAGAEVALCGCGVRVVIRELHGDGSLSSLTVARWPGSIEHHRSGCKFAASPAAHTEQERRVKRLAAITRLGAGIWQAYPAFSMSTRLTMSRPSPSARRTQRGASQAPRLVGLLGLQEGLLRAAQINQYFLSRERDWSSVSRALCRAVNAFRLGNRPLARYLHVLSSMEFGQAEQAQARQAYSSFAADRIAGERYLLAGLVARVNTLDGCSSIYLHCHEHPLKVNARLAARLRVRCQRQMAALRDFSGEAQVLALALVDFSAGGTHHVADVALTLLSGRGLVPCDSIHEVRVANRLVRERYLFEKPMLEDPLTGLVPDFVVHCGGEPVYLEVWGMENLKEYLRHKNRKLRIYRACGIILWVWDPTKDTPMPALPTKRGRFRFYQ
jgi:hypothetical protein